MVLDWHERELDARHGRHFACPQARRIHDPVCSDSSILGDDIPGAIGPQPCVEYRIVPHDLGSHVPSTLGKGLRHAAWVDMPEVRLIKYALDGRRIENRAALQRFLYREPTGLKTRTARCHVMPLQFIHALVGARQSERSNMMEAAGLASFLF